VLEKKTKAKQIIIALGGGEGNSSNKNIGFIEIDKPDNEMLFEIYGSKYILRATKTKQKLRYGQAKIHTAYTILKQRERFG
jgi:hypothetical protein